MNGAAGGEGDGLLVHWRAVHRDCFGRELAPHGRQPEATMPVVCEWFEVVHRPAGSRQF